MKKVILSYLLLLSLCMKVSTGNINDWNPLKNKNFTSKSREILMPYAEKYRESIGYSMEEQRAVYFIAFMLEVDEQWLYNMYKLESSHNSKAVNKQRGDPEDPVERIKLGRATGIIQWMPGTARRLGTTTLDIYNMTKVEQIMLSYKYLKFYKPKDGYKSQTDLYLAIFWPKAMGQTASYQIGGRAVYKGNSGIDRKGNNDGRITVEDINLWMNYHNIV